jgi:hypothetical protein
MTIELIEMKLPAKPSWYFIKLNGADLEGSETPYLDQVNKLYDDIVADPTSVSETIIRSQNI